MESGFESDKMNRKNKEKKESTLWINFKKDWSPFIRFLLKPIMVFFYLYMGSYIGYYFFQENQIYKIYILCITPLITLFFGLLIRNEWDKYKKNTIYNNKAAPAIGRLNGLESDVQRRIKNYDSRHPSKHEIIEFLKDILTRINDTRESWKTFEPETENPFFNELTTTQKDVTTDEDKAKQRLGER